MAGSGPLSDTDYLNKLTRITEAHLFDEKFGVPQLAKAMGVSRSGLHRKVKTLTGNPASFYIREQRLNKSMELLSHSNLTVSEIAYNVGFGSVAYFDRCFREQYGKSPGDMRKQLRAINENPELQPPDTTNNPPDQYEADHRAVMKNFRIKYLLPTMAGVILVMAMIAIIVSREGRPVILQNMHLMKQEKSIAILPFVTESSDVADLYFNNGITSAITDKLANIKDLKVTSQNSAEQFRNNKTLSTPKIARKLGVRYIVEGSGQKSGSDVLITVQLIDARHDKHLLSKRYERKFSDIFNLYNEIALDVASEISALITDEELESLSNPGTARIEAMRLYTQGDELFSIRHIKPDQALDYALQAEEFSRKALELDSTYSDAWVLLADIYLFKEKTDSALLLAHKALHFNRENPKAFVMKGTIYGKVRNAGAMEKSLKTALKYDPGNFWAIHLLGGLAYYRGEFYDAIKVLLRNRQMLGSFDPGFSHPELVYREICTLRLARTLFALGFYDEGRKYAEEWLALSNDDQIGYHYNMLWAGIINNRWDETYQFGLKIPENSLTNDYMAINLMFMSRYDEALQYLVKSVALSENRTPRDEAMADYLLGYAYLKTGNRNEGKVCFDKSLNFFQQWLTLHPENAIPDLSYAITDRYWKSPWFVTTSIYSARGMKDEALQSLRMLRKNYLASDLQVVTLLKKWPMFDYIRKEAEFQEYLKEAEAHYLSEYKKVKNLLDNEGISSD